MKKLIFTLAILLTLSSCISIRVSSDYDTKTDFNNYKTFAYQKSGIDKAEINDLDKRRILRAIDKQLIAKGYTKSDQPQLLISFFTKSNEQVNVNRNNFGWGFGWGFWGANIGTTVSTSTQGVLYIDIINAQTNELIWQGRGSGYLNEDNPEEKEAKINEFVLEILKAYPPQQ